MQYFWCQTGAVALGFLLDLIFGDPHWLYHPVQLIGSLISKLEKVLLKDTDSDKKKFRNGACGACNRIDRRCDNIDFIYLLPHFHDGGFYRGIRHVLSDSCSQIIKGRKHESLYGIKAGRSACGKNGSFHDCRTGYRTA